MGRTTIEHPPCVVCGEVCGSQREHLGYHDSNPRAYWTTCSGCMDALGGEVRFVHIIPARVAAMISARCEGVRRG